jgi:hypothetical protein
LIRSSSEAEVPWPIDKPIAPRLPRRILEDHFRPIFFFVNKKINWISKSLSKCTWFIIKVMSSVWVLLFFKFKDEKKTDDLSNDYMKKRGKKMSNRDRNVCVFPVLCRTLSHFGRVPKVLNM